MWYVHVLYVTIIAYTAWKMTYSLSLARSTSIIKFRHFLSSEPESAIPGPKYSSITQSWCQQGCDTCPGYKHALLVSLIVAERAEIANTTKNNKFPVGFQPLNLRIWKLNNGFHLTGNKQISSQVSYVWNFSASCGFQNSKPCMITIKFPNHDQ